MKYKYSLLGLAAGTALLVASGCSKQEPAASQAPVDASKAPAPAEAAKPATPPAATTDKPAAAQPETTTAATPAPQSPAPTSTPAPATPAPAPDATAVTNTVVAQPAAAATTTATVSNALASALSSNTAPVSTLQSSVKAQQVSFTQSATNQLQALMAAATNQALSTLGTTNLAASTATNQVQALLDRAKSLCANQKYQEALSNITQLYTYKLTSDQKQKADDVANQIKAGIAQKATSALGSFLGGGSK